MCCGAIRCGPKNWPLRAPTNRPRVERLLQERNRYLGRASPAKVATAEKAVRTKIAQLKIEAWLQVEDGRPRLEAASRTSRLWRRLAAGRLLRHQDRSARSAASKQVVHDRYKDLTQVEQAFRTCKTAHLEIARFTCAPRSTPADMCWW